MKKLLSILFLFSFCFGFTQTKDSLSVKEQQRREKNIQVGNPFKKFGYKPKIHTLSKGKYLEFHDLDSIVKIGSFSYHVKNKSLTGYFEKEAKYSEATLRPEIVSRWFSPDHLSDEFPSWSPYNFVMNSPIMFNDPTGLAPEECCGINPGGWLGTAGYMISRTTEIVRRKASGESWASAYANTYKNDAKNVVRYVTPVEDVYGVATGEDFDGNDYNRAEAGGWALASFFPLAKIGKLGKLAKVVTKNGDEIIEVSSNASTAFKNALEGKKHTKTLEFVLDRTLKQNQKSIKNFEKRISLHEGWIENPKAKWKNWDNFTDSRKQRELNHWRTEIKGFQEQIDITKDVIFHSN